MGGEQPNLTGGILGAPDVPFGVTILWSTFVATQWTKITFMSAFCLLTQFQIQYTLEPHICFQGDLPPLWPLPFVGDNVYNMKILLQAVAMSSQRYLKTLNSTSLRLTCWTHLSPRETVSLTQGAGFVCVTGCWGVRIPVEHTYILCTCPFQCQSQVDVAPVLSLSMAGLIVKVTESYGIEYVGARLLLTMCPTPCGLPLYGAPSKLCLPPRAGLLWSLLQSQVGYHVVNFATFWNIKEA